MGGRTGKRSGGNRMLIGNIQRFDPHSHREVNLDAQAKFNSVRNQVRQQWLITGVTKDSTGAALGGCTVTLFKTIDNQPSAITTSDANGVYSFSIDGNSQARFAVSYKAGSPDVAGTTVNTLVPVLT